VNRRLFLLNKVKAITGVCLLAVCGITTVSAADPDSDRDKTAGIERYWITLGLGYGFSFPTDGVESFAIVKPQEGSEFAAFLDRTNMEYSQNVVTARVGAGFNLTERLSFFLYVPYGVVEQPASSTLPGLVDYDYGVGDLSGGLTYALLSESESRPDLDVTLIGDTDHSKFTSLGDGFRGMGAHIRAQKFITDTVYGFASTGYTHRFETNAVEPGAIVKAGGGLGTLVGSGKYKADIELVYTEVKDTRFPEGVFEGSGYYSAIFGLREAGARFNSQFYLAGLNDDFKFDEVRVGFELDWRILP